MAKDVREFDLVLMGATGFTGRLVAEYLLRAGEKEGLKWALAGRNEKKLQELKDQLGKGADALEIIVADSLDRESLEALARRTQVVCSTVGPYSKYGTPLVEACVQSGTDYCDLTGEAHWIRKIIDLLHDKAEKNQARIVHCCGFDSIPSDLGVLMMQRAAKRKYSRPAQSMKYFLARGRGGVSGGTLDSVATSMEEVGKNKKVARQMADPYGLNPESSPRGSDGGFQKGVAYDRDIQGWTAPFVMAVINEKIVRRSNALLENEYGQDFNYSEVSLMGSGVSGALKATGMTLSLGAFAGGMALAPTRRLLQRFVLPSPGEGPDEAAREAGYFNVKLFARGVDDEGKSFTLKGAVGADKDPGYGATAIMLGESALCLALDGEVTAARGGILTPAVAMGERLIERLKTAGMTFEVHED